MLEASHRLDSRRRLLHAREQRAQVLGPGQLDADQCRAELAVVALDVLEQRDVVFRAEHVVEEPAQRAGLLRELDQEVVLAPLVHQCPLDHLGGPADVVGAAGHDAHAGGPGRYRDGLREHALAVGPGRGERGGGQRPGRLGDDAVGLVELQHLAAHPALRDGEQRGARGGDQRVGHLPGPADGRPVDERVEFRQRDRAWPARKRSASREAQGGPGRPSTPKTLAHFGIPLSSSRPGHPPPQAARRRRPGRYPGRPARNRAGR